MTTTALKGRVALVTGGTGGVGGAVVRALAEAGADVAFTYASSHERAGLLADEVTGLGGRALPVQVDQADVTAAAAAVGGVLTGLGRLDILVHNAVYFVDGELADPDRDEAVMSRQFAVNLHSVVAMTKAAAPHLGDGGRIILISSYSAAVSGGYPVGDYAATKAAVEAYGHNWAHEFGRRGTTVNMVRPGGVDNGKLSPDMAERMLPRIPMGRLGTPADVAAVVRFLAGPEAGFVNGATVTVNGGSTA
ncbi:SDR family NAD(P)-dependent oxidoreductase [Crossiella sp. CA198]|uniref:SDR family NAD(P)-dependent oxidoreductase n=1 Tax=Crossiella sp. CA198 TaxID=3455607 RepID=UPI003F8D7CFF